MKCEKETLSDKSLGEGVAIVIIHLDKLFISHTSLPSAGQSAVPRTQANVLTCMLFTTSMSTGLKIRYMDLIRVTKMQNNEMSGS